MSDHDFAYCPLCQAGTPHQGLVTPVRRETVSAGTGPASPVSVRSVSSNSPGALLLAEPETVEGPADLESLFGALLANATSFIAALEVAEEELLAAQQRHGEEPPERDDTGKVIGEKGPLWRSFRLLCPTGGMGDKAEFVHRAHCRELLDRVAAGQDTRPATDAEMVLALCQVSLAVPLHGVAVGLYMRLFARCFPQHAMEPFGQSGLMLKDYERMYGQQIDDQEAWLRRKARQDWRRPTGDDDEP